MGEEYKQSFCPECGFGVRVDEDGLCIGCGATAVGSEVNKIVNPDALRKLVERWRKMSNGNDYYDPDTFADELEELIGGQDD